MTWLRLDWSALVLAVLVLCVRVCVCVVCLRVYAGCSLVRVRATVLFALGFPALRLAQLLKRAASGMVCVFVWSFFCRTPSGTRGMKPEGRNQQRR